MSALLDRCNCGKFHDQSASCALVAHVLKLNQRRDRLIARLCRKGEI